MASVRRAAMRWTDSSFALHRRVQHLTSPSALEICSRQIAMSSPPANAHAEVRVR